MEIVSIYQSDRGTDMSEGKTDLDVDRCGTILLLWYLLFGLFGVGHTEVCINGVW